ncbi:MAG TPA: signal peptidase I [Verrucomicrobiae bacterium]|nr:signal peptidase I [Verrucomicrobiae bacterium]
MRWARCILNGLGVTGFVLCCAAVLLFNKPTLGWQLLSVPTSSMRPTFAPGSLVLTHRVPIQTLKVGDIITYTNPLTMRSTLTHRIIKKYRLNDKIPAFITKGDANPSPDPPVVEGLVQGRMVAHTPFLGYLFMWAKTWVGIAVLVYIPALLIMVGETRRLAVHLQRMKPYRLEGFVPPVRRLEGRTRARIAFAASGVLAVVFAGVSWQTAVALAGQSNMVMLVPNILAVTTKSAPPVSSNTRCSSSTTVNATNTAVQTATTGNATVSGGSGSASSGSASISSAMSNSITVQNSCSS